MKTQILAAAATFASTLAPAPTNAAEKKETVQQFVERYFAVVDSKDLSGLDAFEVGDIVMTSPMGVIKGSVARRQMTQGFATAFPNMKHSIGRCIESNNTIACEGRFLGDHTGPMMMPTGQSIPATGKHVDFSWAGFMTLKGRKIAALNVYFDPNVMMQQLGLIPAPGKVAAAK